MDLKSAQKRINELTNLIKYHNDIYYNHDKNIISDSEYDKLYHELQQLEKEFPFMAWADTPTKRVGGSIKKGLKPIKHNAPMLSLKDVFDKDAVMSFVDNIREKYGNETKFMVERKIDGLSVALRYENGIFTKGLTRGDGITQGEDVTENLRMIASVINRIPESIPYMELRGEVYMTKSSFKMVNDIQISEGKEPFANPRNCAAATLRQLDPALVKRRNLSIFIFDIQVLRGKSFNSHYESMKCLKRQGIVTIEGSYLCESNQDVWTAIESIGRERMNFDYDIDGAVIKIDNIEQRGAVGSTVKVPLWAIAYKYHVPK